MASHAIHGLLGREGRSPAAFLDEARHELTRYTTISLRGTRVTDITPTGDEFEFVCADGTTGIASKVLLATGLVDELPDLLESKLYTAFPSIIVSTATASNMRESP
jgi:thioredoxin reductase